jgi:flagellar assembly protein FliH
LSRAFVRAEADSEVKGFLNLLPTLEKKSVHGPAKAKLGRTAEGIQKLKEEARQEGIQEGFAEGFAAGREDGFQSVREEMERSVQEFKQALDAAAERVEGAIGEWYAASEEALSELSVLIAARILGRELSTSQDVITALVREAVGEVAAADRIRIRVNPFDAKILALHKDLVLAAHPTVRNVEIVDDPSISGGAKIESEAGAIDAAIRTQLELAYEALRRPTK